MGYEYFLALGFEFASGNSPKPAYFSGNTSIKQETDLNPPIIITGEVILVLTYLNNSRCETLSV